MCVLDSIGYVWASSTYLTPGRGPANLAFTYDMDGPCEARRRQARPLMKSE